MNENKLQVAGYVKLAKLWERSKDAAIETHYRFYGELFEDSEDFELVDVYIDITGQKTIPKRMEMVRLLRDCMAGKIDVIATQTRAYLAANPAEFCYLVKFLFDLETTIDIITEDEQYKIDTLVDEDGQREALYAMADQFVSMTQIKYADWLERLLHSIEKLGLVDQEGDDYGKRE